MRARSGFTLIEILAVVAIIALAAGFMVPNMGAYRSAQLRNEAERIQGMLELARQRSVMTSKPHRLLIDLDSMSYRLEWKISSEGGGDDAGSETTEADLAELLTGEKPLSLAPPPIIEANFEPLPSRFGRFTTLPDDLYFGGVETRDGWTDIGRFTVEFARDGTTDFAAIVLDDASGGSLTLDVLPLADAVRIRDES
jgi:prepilin-type N-terminal cleavage/methylation domain-containing protein